MKTKNIACPEAADMRLIMAKFKFFNFPVKVEAEALAFLFGFTNGKFQTSILPEKRVEFFQGFFTSAVETVRAQFSRMAVHYYSYKCEV
ncbi:MAG TPA: hypothetical protein VK325_08100 [Pseudoxanthomonas sp.]|nr:hypothetical protein [Pseudoxanthomonas sp.]